MKLNQLRGSSTNNLFDIYRRYECTVLIINLFIFARSINISFMRRRRRVGPHHPWRRLERVYGRHPLPHPRPAFHRRRLDQGRQDQRVLHAAEGMGRVEGSRLLGQGSLLQHVHVAKTQAVVDRGKMREMLFISTVEESFHFNEEDDCRSQCYCSHVLLSFNCYIS